MSKRRRKRSTWSPWKRADQCKVKVGQDARVIKPGVTLGPEHVTGEVVGVESFAVSIQMPDETRPHRYARHDVEVRDRVSS